MLLLLLLAGIHFAQHPKKKALTSGGSRPSDNGGGGGGGHPDPEIGGEKWSPKKFFSALQVLVWSKDKWGGGEGGRAPPLDPPLFTPLSLSVCTLCVLVNLSSFILHVFMYHEF